MIIKYFKCDPGGNITALVSTKVDHKQIILISRAIMEKDSEIEQVGFIGMPIYFPNADGRIHMMGGEFCGNASRCFAWLLAKQGKGKSEEDDLILNIESSGTDRLLNSKIDKQGKIRIEMPIKKDWDNIRPIEIMISENQKIPARIVSMDGITHVLVEDCPALLKNKNEAERIMENLDLLGMDACGVIYYSKIDNNHFSIKPFVWVKDTQTLIEETACSSGTIALAQAESKNQKIGLNLRVIQPSKKELEASIEMNNSGFTRAVISGKVEILGEFSLSL